MRISHSAIEECSRNPGAWVTAKINPFGGGPRTGYNGVVKLAIYRFHDTSDRNQAKQHLLNLLPRFGLSNSASVRRSCEKLESYIDWFEREMPVVAARKLRLELDIGHDWVLGGEVGRVDLELAEGGYRGILLGTAALEWHSERRMPLIQRGLAERLQRNEEDVAVGFQDVDGSNLVTHRYSAAEIDAAYHSATRLAAQLSSEWRRQTAGP